MDPIRSEAPDPDRIRISDRILRNTRFTSDPNAGSQIFLGGDARVLVSVPQDPIRDPDPIRIRCFGSDRIYDK